MSTTMNTKTTGLPLFALLFSVLALSPLVTGCGGDTPAAASADAAADASEAEPTSDGGGVTNRTDIPPIVRRNLGITFAEVERRRVAETLRVPGRFEHLATARVEYRAPLAGRVKLLVRQYDAVREGDPLYSVDSPEWRRMQQELSAASRAGGAVSRRLESLDAHILSLEDSILVWEKRIENLERVNEVGGGRATELAEARASLAQSRADLAAARDERAGAEVDLLEMSGGAEGEARNVRFDRALKTASSITGLSVAELLATADTPEGPAPLWETIDMVTVRAARNGNVETVAMGTGGWAAEGDMIVSAVDHSELVFRALSLQSDLGLMRDGMKATIVPPEGGSLDMRSAVPGRMEIGLDADPHERTIDLLVYPESLEAWMRPGVAAYAEIVLDETPAPVTAIPLSCVVTDGLDRIFFLRDRSDPDRAVRMVADLGISDGRWIEVRSGVRSGDEIVLHGVYELKLATAATSQAGGHFHSDGTWHADHD